MKYFKKSISIIPGLLIGLTFALFSNLLFFIDKAQAQKQERIITPNDVYAQVMLITDELHFLLDHYGLEHDHEGIIKRYNIKTQLKPRNTWQQTYEILVKINILRVAHQLPVIEPVNMVPVLYLNPDLVYEQTQRILNEINIFKYRQNIHSEVFELQNFSNKSPIDVHNALTRASAAFDELNRTSFTPSYVFAESMRIYEDLSVILQHLEIPDKTIPSSRNDLATSNDTFNIAMKTLAKIKQLQIGVAIETVDFSGFRKQNVTPSDVFTMTQMILAELQTIKAYIGLKNYITPAAIRYDNKAPADVDQLMNWNLRKLSLIHRLGGY